MKKYEVAALGEAELKVKLSENKKKINDLIFGKVTEPLQNPMIIRNLKRENARMLTSLNKIQKQKKS